MAKKSRPVAMGERYNELRAEGKSSDEAATQVNQEFGKDIVLKTVRRYGSDVKKRAKQEKLTTEPVDATTPDLFTDTTVEVEPTTSDTSSDTTASVESTTPDLPQSTETVVSSRESVTDEELQVMRDVIQWWQQGGQKTMQRLTNVPLEDLKARPTFPGKKTNSGIRVNDRLFRAAVEKCKTAEAAPRTGGSLSSLIEVLLWGYLGNDPAFLRDVED